MFGCLSRRDDANTFTTFCMRNDDHMAFQQSQGKKAGFTIIVTSIFDRDGYAIKDKGRIHKVNTVLADVGLPLCLIPFKVYIHIVVTFCGYVKPLGDTDQLPSMRSLM